MGSMGEGELSEELEFAWGRKSGRGGLNKGCQFYKSFRYDGLEYLLYDCVYLYKDGEPEPYIGKIIKIWEHYDRSRKVKVLWFFRPCEISNYIGDEVKVVENELFLASGNGVGLTNINPLEAIAGKCYVICTSKDRRNIQPSDEEVQMADYIFYRTFDVKQCKIIDEMPEEISNIDITFLLNQMPLQRPGSNIGAFQKPAGNVDALQKPGSIVDSPQKPGGIVDATVVPSDKNLPKENPAVKTDQTCNELDDRPSKKAKLHSSYESKDCIQKVRLISDGNDTKCLELKLDSSYKSKDCIQKLRIKSDGDDTKVLAPTAPYTDDAKVSAPSKKRMPNEKTTMVSDGKLTKESAIWSQHQNHKIDGPELEVTRRPQADKSKWFAEVGSWEDRLRYAHQQGRLVLLQNLDPAYTSAEVEDIVHQGFNESCKAKMIQRTAFSSPHSGQAFVVFNTRQTAEAVVKKLEEGCLLLSNERPLLGKMGTPCFPEKKPKFFGHIVIDKLRSQMPREMKDAISTSHCSQPNTLEYDMALEWCLLRERLDLALKRFYKEQGLQMRKLMGKLKSKKSLRL
ncbi:protein ANTI-SILENCING 1 [Ziziphus jujuba]|uniref:Protein ANTI-SILENCING 1 n=3 Tax=Ziziphus jujuba TaxID=326968 RepID=A0A6P4AHH4_ZIZJJ|nr:protein ANTI-SILENCING 1 [Ziziphus jujuba]XP_015885218.3 protein ANTI-SILENCING 1 [Ziziphus jujuba]